MLLPLPRKRINLIAWDLHLDAKRQGQGGSIGNMFTEAGFESDCTASSATSSHRLTLVSWTNKKRMHNS